MTSIEELIEAKKVEIATKEEFRARKKSDLRKFFSGMLVGDAMGLIISIMMGKEAYVATWIAPIYAIPCAAVTVSIAVWLYVKK
jgi:hypothetical protein